MKPWLSFKRRLQELRRIPWRVTRYERVLLLLNPDNYVDRKICFEGGYEARQRQAFFALAQQQKCTLLLDIGANFGLYSFTAEHQLPLLKEIHAFECDKRNHAHFMANQRLNNSFEKITLHAVAVGNADGEIRFNETSLKNSGKSHIDARKGNTRVKQVKLDNYLKPHGTAALKIDVEGAELPALQGMQQWLKKHVKVIQIETFPPQTDQVLALLTKLGFKVVSQVEADYLLVKG